MGLRKNNPRNIANKRTGGKRTAEQREADMRFCTDLFVRGYAYREIANKLNEHNLKNGMRYTLSCVSIHNDIKQVLAEWKKENMDAIGDHVALELKKLDMIEVELWEAWERSKGGKRKTRITGGSLQGGSVRGGELESRQLEDSNGDPRYIDLLLKVQERRAKLLGYNAPVKVDFCSTNPSVTGDAVPKYDIRMLKTEMLVQVATELQDAAFMRRKEEGADDGAE